MRIFLLLLVLALSIFTISCVDFGSRPEEEEEDADDDLDDDVDDDADDDVDDDVNDDVNDDADDDIDDDVDDDIDECPTDVAWKDANSGYCWQNPPFEGYKLWWGAKTYCNNLSLGGNEDWRLPSISELRSLIRGCNATETGGSCGVTDECLDSSCIDDSCNDCYSGRGFADFCYWPSELNDECNWYWSSSEIADYDNNAWLVGFHRGGEVNGFEGFSAERVRCVR